MERTLISHDPVTGDARVRFEHDGITLEDDFNLKLVIPGSERIFTEMEIEFGEEFQIKALDKLTETVQRQIEEGVIKNPPEPETHSTYTPPPEAEAPSEEESPK